MIEVLFEDLQNQGKVGLSEFLTIGEVQKDILQYVKSKVMGLKSDMVQRKLSISMLEDYQFSLPKFKQAIWRLDETISEK